MSNSDLAQDLKKRIQELTNEIELVETQIEESRRSNIGDDEVLVQELEDKLLILVDELRSLNASASELSVVKNDTEYTVEVMGKEIKLKIVPASISNPSNGLISIETPLGATLVGKKPGDKFTVTTPSGELEYTVKGVKA